MRFIKSCGASKCLLPVLPSLVALTSVLCFGWFRTSKDLPRIRVPIGNGVVGHTVSTGLESRVSSSGSCLNSDVVSFFMRFTGQRLNIRDMATCPWFNSSVDKKFGFVTRNMLCVPIVSDQGAVVGVLQVRSYCVEVTWVTY